MRAIVLVLLAGLVGPAQAQQRTSFTNRTLYGGGVDVVAARGAGIPLVGLQVTQLAGKVVLPDMDVSMIWLLLAFAANVNLGVGVALEDPGHNVLLLLRGGPSVTMGFTTYESAAAAGYHGGLGLLIRADEETAVRFDVTRQVPDWHNPQGWWRIGFSITELGSLTSATGRQAPGCGCGL